MSNSDSTLDQMNKTTTEYNLLERREIAAIYPHRFFMTLNTISSSGRDLRYELLDVRDPDERYIQIAREDYLAVLEGSHASSLESIAAALGGNLVIDGSVPSIVASSDDSAKALEHLAEHLVGIEPDVGLVLGTDSTEKPEPS